MTPTPRPAIRAGLAGVPAEVDVVVVGLGVTGAGVALDAASRGLSVLAVDAHDLAFGTSRWSSKLVHGGLRYLASGQVAIAHESAVERGILMEVTAPHLTRPMPYVLPFATTLPRRTAGPSPAPASSPPTCCAAPPTPPAPRCRRRAGSRPPSCSRWRRRCARRGSTAASWAGTASSRTTPAWSPPSPAPPPPSGPRCAPVPGCCRPPAGASSCATSSPARPTGSPPVPSSTPPGCGPATSPRR